MKKYILAAAILAALYAPEISTRIHLWYVLNFTDRIAFTPR